MGESGRARKVLRHEEVAATVAGLIEKGAYRPGDRLPSIRELSRKLRVSLAAVLGAYVELEARQVLVARPRAGYYVLSKPLLPEESPDAAVAARRLAPRTVEQGTARRGIVAALGDPWLLSLAQGTPDPGLVGLEKLNRQLGVTARRFGRDAVSYAGSKGMLRLRRQIARRALARGCQVGPDDLVITTGCSEAVTLALLATCRRGDTVAVPFPCHHRFLDALEALGLEALEIPATAAEGLNVDALRRALADVPIGACLVSSNFDDPLGAMMPDERKRELVALLRVRDVPLIEDDVAGELAFVGPAPPSLKAFDDRGLVLTCSSFSKTLAPGYRVGWIAPGRYQEKVEKLKAVLSVSSASPTQLAIAEFLTTGGYDRHLRELRCRYAEQVDRMRGAIGRAFPPGTRVTRPQGGALLWVEMPEGVSAIRLFEEARQAGIAIAPGPLFTAGHELGSCIRLSAAAWSPRIERAIEIVGGLARGHVAASGPIR